MLHAGTSGVRSGESTFPCGLRQRSGWARAWAGGPPPTIFKQQRGRGKVGTGQMPSRPEGRGCGPWSGWEEEMEELSRLQALLAGRHCRKRPVSTAHQPESCCPLGPRDTHGPSLEWTRGWAMVSRTSPVGLPAPPTLLRCVPGVSQLGLSQLSVGTFTE